MLVKLFYEVSRGFLLNRFGRSNCTWGRLAACYRQFGGNHGYRRHPYRQFGGNHGVSRVKNGDTLDTAALPLFRGLPGARDAGRRHGPDPSLVAGVSAGERLGVAWNRASTHLLPVSPVVGRNRPWLAEGGVGVAVASGPPPFGAEIGVVRTVSEVRPVHRLGDLQGHGVGCLGQAAASPPPEKD